MIFVIKFNTETMKIIWKLYAVVAAMVFMSCTKAPENPDGPGQDGKDEDIVYDETGCLYTSYEGLVMAGYQGWFNAEGDGANRGWNHYCTPDKKFEPGHSTIDFWPDMSEYEKMYETKFKFKDGSPAYVFSPYDYSTVDLHFKWMKDYGLDGVFLQRFLTTTKSPEGKNHVDKVFDNALKASEKYGRAFCLMYDLSGSKPEDFVKLIQDWDQLVSKYDLFNNKKHPTYLRHNGKPLLAIWGVGFSDDKRAYNTEQVYEMIKTLRGKNNKISIMLGVPYFWRELRRDAVNDPLLHVLIKDVDVIMDWGMGRYTYETFEDVVINDKKLKADIDWCNKNDVLFAAHTYPGGSTGNLQDDVTRYDWNPRLGGKFMWKQFATAIGYGAKALYVGMFDEVDEGTQIFKCLRNSEVPVNLPEKGYKFVGYEDNLPTDHYLWLVGEATKWLHGEVEYGPEMPDRN